MEIKCKCGNVGTVKGLGFLDDEDCNEVQRIEGFYLSSSYQYVYITCEECGNRICLMA